MAASGTTSGDYLNLGTTADSDSDLNHYEGEDYDLIFERSHYVPDYVLDAMAAAASTDGVMTTDRQGDGQTTLDAGTTPEVTAEKLYPHYFFDKEKGQPTGTTTTSWRLPWQTSRRST